MGVDFNGNGGFDAYDAAILESFDDEGPGGGSGDGGCCSIITAGCLFPLVVLLGASIVLTVMFYGCVAIM